MADTSEKNRQKFLSLLKKSFSNEKKTLLKDGNGISITKDARAGHKSLIYVVIPTEQETLQSSSIPLFFKIDFLEEKDLGYFTPKKRHWRRDPIDILSRDDYYFQPKTSQIKDRLGNTISLEEAVSDLYAKHTDPSLIVRLQLLLIKIILTKILVEISDFLDFLTWLLFEKGNRHPSMDKRMLKYHTGDSIRLSANPSPSLAIPDTMSFLGYQISKWTIASFSAVNLALYTVFQLFDLHSYYLHSLFSNAYLASLFAIFAVTIYDLLLPKWIKVIIKKLDDKYWELIFREIKL